NGLHSVIQRCCRWLLTTQDRIGSQELHITHEFLAQMLGVRRASVTEVLRPLQIDGLIRASRGKVVILDAKRLADASCECYGVIGVLVALLLPAVQMAREASRRTKCQNNLKQLGLGMHTFHDTFKKLPFNSVGSLGYGRPSTPSGSWAYNIMPFVELQALYQSTDGYAAYDTSAA